MSPQLRWRTPCAGVFLALTVAFGLPVEGQSTARDQDERLRQGADRLAAQREARAEAEALAALEGEDVTWADVLANPDDIETSYRWARKQVREGELRGAAATLERILLLKPDLAGVRLLYAIVLYRLDSLVEAERELDTLADGPLSETERAEVERYRKQVARSQRRTRVDTSLTFGANYETNRNSAPLSGSRLIQLGGARLELDLVSSSREQDDFAFYGLAQAGFEHDLGLHEGHVLLGSFSTYVSQQLDLGDFNTRAYALDLGGRYRTRVADVTPRVVGSVIQLSSETFLKTAGLDIAVDRSVSPRFSQRFGVRGEWQDYDAIRQSATSNEHTGVRAEARVGASFRPRPTHQLDGDFLYLVKDARGSATPRTNDVFSYDGPELRLRHTWLLGSGRFLMTQVLAGRDSYWRADRRISTKRRRRDVRARANVVIGVPLESLMPWRRAAEIASGTVLTVGADYYRVESNLTNYTYDDTKVSLAISRQWSF